MFITTATVPIATAKGIMARQAKEMIKF